MTTFNKTTLKTFFEQGDIPTGTNYADLIDSQFNLVETAVQVAAGALSVPELITSQVSATNARFTGGTFQVNVSNVVLAAANTMSVSAANSITVSAANSFDVYTGNGASLRFGGSFLTVGTNMNLVADNIFASAPSNIGLTAGTNVNITPGALSKTNLNGVTSAAQILQSVAIVSAAGTTQGAAASLTGTINRGKGIVDGSTTGFTPLANKAGLVQYLFNEGPSANLWPPTGGTINGLAANAVFPLAASAMVTIVHLTASAYAVK